MSRRFLTDEPVKFAPKFLVDSDGRIDEVLIADAETPRKRLRRTSGVFSPARDLGLGDDTSGDRVERDAVSWHEVMDMRRPLSPRIPARRELSANRVRRALRRSIGCRC